MLTAAQRAEFDEVGFVRFEAFSTAAAAAMQEAIWDELARVHKVRRDDRQSWQPGAAYGLRHIRESPTFLPIGGSATETAIDSLLCAGGWDAPKRWGAFLVTFPMRGHEWTVPHRVWHADFAFDLPADPIPGVKVFVFISDVLPRMGGTLVVAGSHTVIRNAVARKDPATLHDTQRTRLQILDSCPWLRALSSKTCRQDRLERFMDATDTVDGTPLRVVELTGRAGDIVLTHPWLLHCQAPNCGSEPRFMRSVDIYRRALHPSVYRAGRPG